MERLREISLDAYDRLIGLDLSEVAVEGASPRHRKRWGESGKKPGGQGQRGAQTLDGGRRFGHPTWDRHRPGQSSHDQSSHDSPLFWARPSTTPSGGCRSTPASTSTVPTTLRSPGRSWSAAAWSA
jgi:hypothetical protein